MSTDRALQAGCAGAEHRLVTTHIDIERAGRTARMVVTGEVGVTALAGLAAAAARIHPAHDHVVIDLRSVQFIDVRGFEHVLAVRDVLAATGCRVDVETAGMTDWMIECIDLVGG